MAPPFSSARSPAWATVTASSVAIFPWAGKARPAASFSPHTTGFGRGTVPPLGRRDPGQNSDRGTIVQSMTPERGSSGDAQNDGRSDEQSAGPGRSPGPARTHDGKRRFYSLAAARRVFALRRRIGAAGQKRPHQSLYDRRRRAAPRRQIRSAARSDRARRGDTAAPHHRSLLRRARRRRYDPHRPAARQLYPDVQPAPRFSRRDGAVLDTRSVLVDPLAGGGGRGVDRDHRRRRVVAAARAGAGRRDDPVRRNAVH